MRALLDRRAFMAGAIAGSTLGANRAFAQSGDIVLGATVPLTGPLAASGQQYHFALQLAQDDINAKGGISGRKIRIAFEDTQASNSVAVNAFIKLAKEHNPPFIFLSSYSTQNLATEPEVAKEKIPTMYAGGADAIHQRKNAYMFRLRPYDTVTTTAIARFVAKSGKKKAAIIYVQDDFGQGSANGVEGLLKAAGVEVVAKEAYGARDNDMQAQLAKIKNAAPEYIVGFSYVRDGALVFKGRTSLGMTNIPVVTSGATVLPPTLALLDPADLEGVSSTTDAFLDPAADPMIKSYVERFEARFKLRPDPFGSCYYDGALMLAEALRKVGPDREKIRAELAKIRGWKGVTQTYSADETGNLAHATTLVQFKKGTKEFALIEKIALK
jgi:branched-chain amino acid transport system substrate-binding protein